jgi:ribosomal-protein-alanine N-acetyltransferase
MELHGNCFKLRGWRADDVISIQKHADNPNIYSYLLDRFPHPYTIEAAKAWVDAMLQLEPNYNFVIDIDGEAVGVVGLEMRDDVYSRSPLIGYWIGESFWGRGVMTQAIKLVTGFAFTQLNAIRVHAGVLGNNPRSMHVLEKAGFVKEGILKNSMVKNGVILDEHVYGLVNPMIGR